jgi:hypothetical protein
MKEELIDYYINKYKDNLKFDLIVKTPILNQSISLYFDKDCQYSKSVLWSLRKDVKQLKIVNSIDKADYIILPKLIDKVEDEIGELTFSYLQGQVHLIEHLPSDYSFKSIDNIESNKPIIQETDLNWILGSYLDLQLIDQTVVDTLEGLFMSSILEVDLLTNLNNQLDWSDLDNPYSIKLLKLFQDKFSREFIKTIGNSKLRKSWVYILNAYYQHSKTERYPFTFYEKDDSWIQAYLTTNLGILLQKNLLDSESFRGLNKFQVLEEICLNNATKETPLEKYETQFNSWLEKTNLPKSTKMKNYLRQLLL